MIIVTGTEQKLPTFRKFTFDEDGYDNEQRKYIQPKKKGDRK